MNQNEVEQLNLRFKDKSPEEVIEFAIKNIGKEKLVLASSLSIEDQVLTHMLLTIEPKARIFFIDTGRHYQETYNVMNSSMERYGFRYEVYAPNNEELQNMVSSYGPNLFYNNLELRKKCCEIRKVEPLKRVLSTSEGWICGLRRGQSQDRQNIELFEWDSKNGIFKINPIAYWSEEQVWDYMRKENIPYNSLHLKGFPSIGCQPCTRAVADGADIRSGRWWWESSEHKECGLHRS
ncbi:MAG: phosphoadenylyl-sulfate reductase [Firmicutes bacterium HGW-Firmicutes-1]|jgi:phosphoadenosine phosphosulfate reductase|nr:MAG: phosphoadenylyl-sulfate reductase [Firmicutes bacterium HGW-Firmicutes-1]